MIDRAEAVRRAQESLPEIITAARAFGADRAIERFADAIEQAVRETAEACATICEGRSMREEYGHAKAACFLDAEAIRNAFNLTKGGGDGIGTTES